MNNIEGMGMTWLEIALVVTNVVTIAVAAWRFTGRVAELQREIDRCDRAVSYYCDRVCRLAKSNRTQGFALRYYANPQAWQSPHAASTPTHSAIGAKGRVRLWKRRGRFWRKASDPNRHQRPQSAGRTRPHP